MSIDTRRATEVGPLEVHRRGPAPWKFPFVFTLTAVVLVFALWATASELLGGDPSATLARIELPDISGIPADQASGQLEALGFVVNVRYSPNEVVPRGEAFAQDPRAGAKVEQGGVIDVMVSDGPLGTTVPDVAGQQASDAAALMLSMGLQVTTSAVPDEQAPIGQMLRTEPAKGQRIPLDGTVTFVISSGPAPRTVPQLVGLTIDQALVAVGRAGLVVGDLSYEQREGAAEGSVLAASQTAGVGVPRDTPIDLTIAGTGGQVVVPYLVGLRQSSAQTVLRSAGLTAAVVTQPIDGSSGQAGRVIAQSVAPQAKATKGSAVQITVAVSAPPTGP